jgi:hypothetical protein
MAATIALVILGAFVAGDAKGMSDQDVANLARAAHMTKQQLKNLAAECETNRSRAIDEISTEISQLDGLLSTTPDSGSQQEIRARIRILRARRKAIQKREEVIISTTLQRPLSVGQIGTLPFRAVRVKQALMLVEVGWGDGSTTTVLMRGISSSGLPYNANLVVEQCLRLAGGETLANVDGGSRAVLFVVKPYDTKPAGEYMRKSRAKRTP